MNKNILQKIKIIIKTIRVFKNWYLYPIVYFKLTKNDYVIFETKNNLKIKIRVNSTDLMALTHVWLIEEYSSPGFEINENDLIIDIGAHIGLFSLFSSQYCKNGKILSFEPIKENYELLVENLRLNNIKNVYPFNKAVSENNSDVTIFLNKDESGHSMYSSEGERIQVKSTSLKMIFEENKLDKCDFLKLDCEGAEYSIIDSLSEEYFDKIEKMIIEYHLADTKSELLSSLKSKLKTFSFSMHVKPLFSDIGFLYAKK